ncbi:MAG: hypothetical protein JWQ73_336 [Variovorax sp.]|nr:hypothetical protein [Variovorax sp.]
MQFANVVLAQIGWFAAVLGAACDAPLWGMACVLAVIAWHIAMSARPAPEAALVAWVCLIGFAAETIHVALGNVAYPSGQPFAHLPPYWMVGLWGLFAIQLNVTLRWLRPRLWLAVVLGAVAGPASFVSGVRLGGAHFIHTTPALVELVVSWAVLMPLLVWLSMRFDGVTMNAVDGAVVDAAGPESVHA